MQTIPITRRPRGRPRNDGDSYPDTRAQLIRCGLERLTEGGFSALTIDDVLKRTGLPKGSFYHQFETKEAFAIATLEAYADYFATKLERHFVNIDIPPLARINAFVADAAAGLARHEFRRGCLVGNLGQEASTFDAKLRQRLEAILCDWENHLAACLDAAISAGQLPPATDSAALAHAFWIGWEGAILRTRLTQSDTPLHAFYQLFKSALPTVANPR